MDIRLPHGVYLACDIQLQKYSNERPALVIYQEDEVFLKASVNLPEIDIPEGYICIKNW